MGPHQIKQNMNYSAAHTFEALQIAFQGLKKFKVVRMDNQALVAQAKTSFNFLSYGENIDIVVTPLQNGCSLIDISSRPKMPTAVIDWGINKKNVETILNAVTYELTSRQYPQVFSA